MTGSKKTSSTKSPVQNTRFRCTGSEEPTSDGHFNFPHLWPLKEIWEAIGEPTLHMNFRERQLRRNEHVSAKDGFLRSERNFLEFSPRSRMTAISLPVKVKLVVAYECEFRRFFGVLGDRSFDVVG